MSITLNTKTYSVDSYLSPNKIRYTGPGEALGVKDRIDLGRQYPKPTADYAGNARSQGKFVQSLTDGTDVVGDGIVDIRVQIPVGAATAEVDGLLDDAGDFLISAVAQAVAKALDINH